MFWQLKVVGGKHVLERHSSNATCKTAKMFALPAKLALYHAWRLVISLAYIILHCTPRFTKDLYSLAKGTIDSQAISPRLAIHTNPTAAGAYRLASSLDDLTIERHKSALTYMCI